MISSLLSNMPLTAQSSLYYAFEHSDMMGKCIVLVLILFSIVTWTLMIDKGISLKRAEQDCRNFLAKFRAKHDYMIFADRIGEDPSPAARVCEAAYQRIQTLRGKDPYGAPKPRKIFNAEEIGIVRATLEQAVSDQIIELERKMIFLATAITISPFLGLFGTVWGIMIAFTFQAMMGKADIQTLAPGVSGALLTTVLGLVVAIPSVIGYNIITSRIKNTIIHLDNLTEEFVVKLKMEEQRGKSNAEASAQESVLQ